MKISKNDTVEILTGKDRGKRGKVLSVDPKKSRIVVEGINIATKHQKARKADEVGGIIKKELPIYVWNASLVCSSCKEKTRVGAKKLDDGTKVRICKKCGAEN